MCIYRSLLFSLLFTVSLSAFAQQGNPAQAGEASLTEQYNAMLEASNRYQRFKVVREDFLAAFLSNVQDSVRTYTDRVKDLEETIATQKAKIDEQTKDLTVRQGEIASLNGEKDSINLLGMQLSKATYSILMWGIVGLLLALFLFALGRSRLALAESRSVRQLQEKTAAELEASRKSRLAVEQKLSRQLQDERNKRLGQ